MNFGRQKRIIGFARWGRAIDDARLDDESLDEQAARLLSVVLPDDGGVNHPDGEPDDRPERERTAGGA